MLAAIKTSDKTEEGSENKNDDPAWFQSCIIANSPAGDILVIAKGSKAVFFTSTKPKPEKDFK